MTGVAPVSFAHPANALRAKDQRRVARRSPRDRRSFGPKKYPSLVPIYEFRCEACKKKFSILVGMTAEADDERCPNCGSPKTHRLVSRFARYRNEDDRIDEMADELEVFGEPDSPSEMRGMVREMGKAMDEDMSDEMEEMFEADMEGKLEDEE